MDIEKFRVNVQPVLGWLKSGAPHFATADFGPVGFDMDFIIQESAREDFAGYPCGTTCCIAGYVGIELGSKNNNYVFERAQHHLGLTDDEAIELFCAKNSSLGLDEISPAIAAQTIEHAMETGMIVWPR